MRRLLALAAILGATSVLPGGMPTAIPPAATAPVFDHIFVIVEENMDESQVVGNPNAPFINQLLNDNVRQTNYFALDHGSLPDYLALVSGSEHKSVIGDPPGDCTPAWSKSRPDCALTDPWPSNLADTIEASGRTWRGYFQDMGWPCRWQSNTATYDVTHNPFVYFKTVQGGGRLSSRRCTEHDVDLYQDPSHTLAADLDSEATTPNFVFIAPDNAHNMHDGNVVRADQFLEDLFTGSNRSGANGVNPVNILASAAWNSGRSIAYVFWDEDSGTFWNQVAAVAVGKWVNGPQTRDGSHFTHYSMLRTWEAAWNLAPIGPGDRAASPMLGAFNLLDDGVAKGRSGTFAEPHPEVYAAADVNIPSPGVSSMVLSLGASGNHGFQLVLDQHGHIGFENGSLSPPQVLVSDRVASQGWHRVELHVWTRGEIGTCEVFLDGVEMQSLSQTGTCRTSGAEISSFALGSLPVRNLSMATSPL